MTREERKELISFRLTNALRNNHVNYPEIARKMNRSPEYVKERLQAGIPAFGVELVELCQALNVSPDWLLGYRM